MNRFASSGNRMKLLLRRSVQNQAILFDIISQTTYCILPVKPNYAMAFAAENLHPC